MSAHAPRHLRAPVPSTVHSAPLAAVAGLLTPLVAGLAGVAGVAETPRTVAAPGTSAAVAVRFALAQLGKPYRWGMLAVELGERSKAVAAVQSRLAANRRCVAVDGEFGPRTRRALVAFQRGHGLTGGASFPPHGPGTALSSAACESAPVASW